MHSRTSYLYCFLSIIYIHLYDAFPFGYYK
jgi:hypothetical protein